jgi:flavin-dependent thymidylate synthase
MKVRLIDYTGCGTDDPSDYAANILIFTKNTRLNMSPAGLEEISNWSWEHKIAELSYMANTIPSSQEFIHYTFMIEGVTRAFTHQFVRSRHCSFAQQTMRVLNMKGFDYATGPTIESNEGAQHLYDNTMDVIAKTYDRLIEAGAAIEDARGVLPTNILTNICASMNLRTFCEMVYKRSSPRVQGEYRDVLAAMIDEVTTAHQWVALFLDRTFDRAARDLDCEVSELPISNEAKTKMMKLIDQMRAKQ